MEDAVVIRSDVIGGFSFAAVFDGHAGFSSVKFLRDELYKECIAALQSGLLLISKDFKAVQKALQGAFESEDAKLINWLEMTGEDVESGATATVLLIGNDTLFISHVGDSSALLSCSGKVDELTNPHRPYGRNKVCLQEIKRIREAGGWIVNGRICDDISVSRAFGDIRFKNKKNDFVTFCLIIKECWRRELKKVDGLKSLFPGCNLKGTWLLHLLIFFKSPLDQMQSL